MRPGGHTPYQPARRAATGSRPTSTSPGPVAFAAGVVLSTRSQHHGFTPRPLVAMGAPESPRRGVCSGQRHSPAARSGRRTSVGTASSRRSCPPVRAQQRCAAATCWPGRKLDMDMDMAIRGPDTGDTGPANQSSCSTPLPRRDHPGMDTAAKQWATRNTVGAR